METRRYLRYSRVPSRVPRLRTSAWAAYDTRALDKEGLGDVKLVSPVRTIDTQMIKCVSTLVSQTWCFGVKEGAQYDKRPSTQQNCACYAGYPRTLKRITQKGDPDCASILFGIIRHCEHNFHPFPEKSTANITCTFAGFASQNCHLLIM